MSSQLRAELSASPILQGLDVRVFPGSDAGAPACTVRAEVERAVGAILAGDFEDITDLED